MNIIGWIAWGFTAYIAFINLISQSSTPGVRAGMQRQGFLIAIGCAMVLFFGWNKLFTPLAIPLGMFLGSLLMANRMSNASDMYFEALAESQRSGEPVRQIMKRKYGIDLPDDN